MEQVTKAIASVSQDLFNNRAKKVEDSRGVAYVKHFQTKDGRIVTMAVSVNYAPIGVTLHQGYAVCMPLDTFDQTKGELMSVGRAHKTTTGFGFFRHQWELIGGEKCMDSILNNLFIQFKKTKLQEISNRKK